MQLDKLKDLDVNIHVIATGAGSLIQHDLWQVPGCSAYFGGATFPYSADEQEEVLGFMPEHFCSQEAAVDLACAAYMKAYKFGGRKPVGLGLTASVASEKEHRGEHRMFACVMTDTRVLCNQAVLAKGAGATYRLHDNGVCGLLAIDLLAQSLDVDLIGLPGRAHFGQATHGYQLARDRFFLHPFFTDNGKRMDALESDEQYSMDYSALMPGAFNPPHDGHFGAADAMWRVFGHRVIFEITTNPPHKAELSVQDMLQRAKALQGYDCLFTKDLPLYLDKVKAFPEVPLVMGADAMIRLLDPKWGKSPGDTIEELSQSQTKIYVASRQVDGKLMDVKQVLDGISNQLTERQQMFGRLRFRDLPGQWDISSTQLRKDSK